MQPVTIALELSGGVGGAGSVRCRPGGHRTSCSTQSFAFLPAKRPQARITPTRRGPTVLGLARESRKWTFRSRGRHRSSCSALASARAAAHAPSRPAGSARRARRRRSSGGLPATLAWELEASPPAGPESALAAPQLAAVAALGVSAGCLAGSVFLAALPLVPPRVAGAFRPERAPRPVSR